MSNEKGKPVVSGKEYKKAMLNECNQWANGGTFPPSLYYTKLADGLNDKLIVDRAWLMEHLKKMRDLVENSTSYSEQMKQKYLWTQSEEGYLVFENTLYAVGKPTKFRDLDEKLQKINAICKVKHLDMVTKICLLLAVEEEFKAFSKALLDRETNERQKEGE